MQIVRKENEFAMGLKFLVHRTAASFRHGAFYLFPDFLCFGRKLNEEVVSGIGWQCFALSVSGICGNLRESPANIHTDGFGLFPLTTASAIFTAGRTTDHDDIEICDLCALIKRNCQMMMMNETAAVFPERRELDLPSRNGIQVINVIIARSNCEVSYLQCQWKKIRFLSRDVQNRMRCHSDPGDKSQAVEHKKLKAGATAVHIWKLLLLLL